MQQQDHRQALTELIASLKADKTLKVETAKIGRPLASHVLASIKALKLPIPEDLMAFYRQCDGCHIVWREKGGSASGEICIVPFSETFRMHWKDKLWFDWMKEEGASVADAAQYRLAKALKGFDVMDTLLDKTVIIALEPDAPDPGRYRLWYWDGKGIKFPMRLSPAGYIAEAVRHRGLLRWQLFYADMTGLDMEQPFIQEAFGRQLHTALPAMEAVLSEYNLMSKTDLKELEQSLDDMRSFAAQHKLT